MAARTGPGRELQVVLTTEKRPAQLMSLPMHTHLPPGWASPRVGDVLELRYGKALPKRNRKEGAFLVYGSNGVIGRHDESLTAGPTIVIGRKGTVGAVHMSTEPCWPIDTTYFVEEVPGLDLGYVSYALSALGLSEMDTSSAIPGLNRETVLAQTLPLAPLAEQKRIVAKIEDLMERARVANERVVNVEFILKRFRQSVLSAACAGRLTERWRQDQVGIEPASSLIRRIAASRNAEAGTDTPAEMGILPELWARTTLGFLAEPQLHGRPFVTSGPRGWARHVSEEGPLFIRSENINTDDLRLDEAVRVDAPKGAEAERTRVRGGDLLLTITGDNVGRSAVVPTDVPPAHVSQHVAIIRPTPLADVRYLWVWMRSDEHGQAQLKDHHYGHTKPGLNLKQVKDVWVDLPPLDEQREIVRRLQALFEFADRIEEGVRAAKIRAARLPDSILSKAFRGELVPTEAQLAAEEGREYESASVLLERINELRRQQKSPRQGGERMTERNSRRAAESGRRPLVDVLREQGNPLRPEQLFALAGFDEDAVDEFYEQLRGLIREGAVRESRPNGTDVTLEEAGT